MQPRQRTRMQGVDEFERLLKKMPEKIARKALEGAAMTAANVPRKAMKEAIPRDNTGKSREKTTRRRWRKGPYTIVIRIGWFKIGWWLAFIEFGTEKLKANPFARAAFERSAPEALDVLAQALGKKIEQAARKLAGPYAKSGLARRRSRGRRRR